MLIQLFKKITNKRQQTKEKKRYVPLFLLKSSTEEERVRVPSFLFRLRVLRAVGLGTRGDSSGDVGSDAGTGTSAKRSGLDRCKEALAGLSGFEAGKEGRASVVEYLDSCERE